MMAIGMAVPMMKVLRSEPRNNSTISMASPAPITAASRTEFTELRMKSAWFRSVTYSMSGGKKPPSKSEARRRSAPSATVTVFASGCLRMLMRTAGTPFSRAQKRCSRLVSRTAATSVSGTRPPPGRFSSTVRTSSTVRNLPAVLPTSSSVSEESRPAATSWFAARSASMTWDTVNP